MPLPTLHYPRAGKRRGQFHQCSPVRNPSRWPPASPTDLPLHQLRFQWLCPRRQRPGRQRAHRRGNSRCRAYEFQSPASTISYAWLQRYGIPINGSAEQADPDDDHFSNYREWRAATSPTDAASVLRLRSVSLTGSDLVLTWESVIERSYYLEASTNLCSTACFERVGNNIPGLAGTTSYTHARAAGTVPYFYRVGVEEQ